MVIVMMSAFLLALAITGIVIVLFIASSKSVRRFDLIHWTCAVLCVAVTSVFIAGAIGLGKAARQIDRSADVATSLGSGALDLVRDYIPGNEITTWLSADGNAVPQIESLRAYLHHKFRNAMIWAIVVTVVLNMLYLLLLTTARRSSGTSYGSDGFDDLDADISNFGNFDSSLDDDLS